MATPFGSGLATMGTILAAMATVALIEALIPLRARGRWSSAHLAPNLALTAIAFATNALLDAALVMALFGLRSHGFGVLNRLPLDPWPRVAVVVLTLDFAFYVAHVAMHRIPALWRFHRVHHSDPAVDVTTAIRQHPGESVIRFAFLTAFACALGAPPEAFAIYRTCTALSALAEHANVRLPSWLDTALSLVFTWPNLHKVHHSRDARTTDTNYGNLVSWWDRLFFTFTPARHGATVAYGLDGFDDPAAQTTAALLALPFRGAGAPADTGDAAPSRIGSRVA